MYFWQYMHFFHLKHYCLPETVEDTYVCDEGKVIDWCPLPSLLALFLPTGKEEVYLILLCDEDRSPNPAQHKSFPDDACIELQSCILLF